MYACAHRTAFAAAASGATMHALCFMGEERVGANYLRAFALARCTATVAAANGAAARAQSFL
jgi:hypothetical protein